MRASVYAGAGSPNFSASAYVSNSGGGTFAFPPVTWDCSMATFATAWPRKAVYGAPPPRQRSTTVLVRGAHTSLWSFAGSPPATLPVCMQVAVAAAGKMRDPVEIDHWSRSGSLSTLPTANIVHCGAPVVSAQVVASGIPVPAHAL